MCAQSLHYRVIPIALWAEPEKQFPGQNSNPL
jgi:hypothetical protein